MSLCLALPSSPRHGARGGALEVVVAAVAGGWAEQASLKMAREAWEARSSQRHCSALLGVCAAAPGMLRPLAAAETPPARPHAPCAGGSLQPAAATAPRRSHGARRTAWRSRGPSAAPTGFPCGARAPARWMLMATTAVARTEPGGADPAVARTGPGGADPAVAQTL
eukprot:365011-Chlamydomonas_euryale.AAC.9